MKKVLFTATVDSHILQFHLPFLKLFKEKGYEVHVATNGNEEIPYCDVKHVVSFERSPFKINNLKAIKQLKEIINEEKFDIIHTHTPMGSVVTRLAAKKARKKYHTRVIYTAHGLHFFKGAPLKNWLIFYPVEKYLSKYTDTLILINQEDYDLCKRKFKKCKDIQYVPGVGIDCSKFNPQNIPNNVKKKLRSTLKIKENDFVLTCVARLDKNKNQEFLINVINEFKKRNINNIKLLLVGPDENNGLYQEKTNKLKLEKDVLFLGKRQNIPELLSISNIVVSASYREGLPVNVMEAMASGLPVIGLSCRGIKDLIIDGENGYVIDQNNNNKLEEYIEKILKIKSDKKLCNNISLNNLLKVKKYDVSNILLDMNKIYLRKTKILHLLSSNSYSGAENVACTIIDSLKSKYDCVYCSPIGEIKNKLEKENIKYEPINKLCRKEIKRVINKHHPDIIHAHDFKASIIAGLFKSKATIISHIHKNDPQMKKISIKSIVYSSFISRFNIVIGVSKSIYEEFYYSKKMKNKFVVLPNYIDKEKIISKSTEYRIKKNYDLLYFGRLSEEKNPIEFINIVKNLNKSNISCVMVGDGPLKQKCIEIIKEFKMENIIDMVGFQENPFPYILKSNICIMPSIFEGFGITAIETTILGKPVLNSGVGGLKTIFANDKYLFCENVDEYTTKIEEIFKNGHNIDRTIEEKYCDKEKYNEKLDNIYKKVI